MAGAARPYDVRRSASTHATTLMQGRRRGGNRGFAPGAPARCTSAFRNAAQNADEPSGGGPTAFLDTQHFCEQTGLYPALARARRSASASPTS